MGESWFYVKALFLEIKFTSKPPKATIPTLFLVAVVRSGVSVHASHRQGWCCRTTVTHARHSPVSELQNCNASGVPGTTTSCLVGSNCGQANWDSDQQSLTREKTRGRHNLISADIKILASSSLNHRAAVFSLVRREKLRPDLPPLGDGDKGWTYAKLHKCQWSPGESIKRETRASANRTAVPRVHTAMPHRWVIPERREEQSDAFSLNISKSQAQREMGLGWSDWSCETQKPWGQKSTFWFFLPAHTGCRLPFFPHLFYALHQVFLSFPDV